MLLLDNSVYVNLSLPDIVESISGSDEGCIYNIWGQTALHMAAMLGYTKIIVLQPYGAYVDIIDSNNNTPLGLAVESEHFEITKILNKAMKKRLSNIINLGRYQ